MGLITHAAYRKHSKNSDLYI